MPQPLTRRAADLDGHHVTVVADDGVPISVRTFGADGAPLTVVFAHGHCLHTESWSVLRELLRGAGSAEYRMVFYDHRGHGESGHADPTTYTIDQLAHDLDAVLRCVAPTGPVVLVGHSMGAMVVLAYTRLHPQNIGDRIAGIGLIAGAAGGLTEVGLGRLLNRYAVASLQRVVIRAPRIMLASKRFSRWLLAPLLRETAAGTRRTDPRVASLATAILGETSLLTVSGFLGSLLTYDESRTLIHLRELPALVLAGSADLMIPFAHSVVLASQLGAAELVRIEGAGHSVILDCAEEVARGVTALLDRVGTSIRERYAVAG